MGHFRSGRRGESSLKLKELETGKQWPSVQGSRGSKASTTGNIRTRHLFSLRECITFSSAFPAWEHPQNILRNCRSKQLGLENPHTCVFFPPPFNGKRLLRRGSDTEKWEQADSPELPFRPTNLHYSKGGKRTEIGPSSLPHWVGNWQTTHREVGEVRYMSSLQPNEKLACTTSHSWLWQAGKGSSVGHQSLV